MIFATSKAFWYEMTPAGYPILVKPDGSRSKPFRRKAPDNYRVSTQSVDGWRRSMLYIEEFDMEDITSFACTMESMICCKYEWTESLLFSSCQDAEANVYPFLTKDRVEQCRNNVTAFFGDKNLQASWTPFILHPVCLKFSKKMDDFEPMAIAEIGDSFLRLGTIDTYPTFGTLQDLKKDNYLRDMLYRDRNYD